ncbi:MAG: serine/threonine protein kinase, partial [Blastocatellia bacterium]|nr:serine/threonine protein kinase [Blastocatellia bacterium]
MKICPECRKQFEENVAFCPFDGKQLVVNENIVDLVGRLIDYKYQIHQRIARGGTGSVYAGTHLQLNMPIAVKVMHREMTSDFTSVERFRREAYATMQIRHPNAIAVMDFGITPDNLVYVVMERLQGKSLRDRLKQVRCMNLPEANEIIQQVSAAIAVAHKRGIIHRDLKPENIFLHQDGDTTVVKVLDFGIAKLSAAVEESALELTRQGFVVGTPYYMSPEQCYGKELDARADVYSLGIVLYELLTGRVPFTGRSHTAVAVKQAREKPRPIYELRPEVPPMINAVVMHALEKLPANRPVDVMTFANELESAMKAVTEKEFMKVFLEASEQDLEAAVLLTSNTRDIAVKYATSKKNSARLTPPHSETSAETGDLVNTEVDEPSRIDADQTTEMGNAI